MRRSILRDLGILLGIFGLIWLILSRFSYPEQPQLISKENEEKLGKVYVDLLLLNPMLGEYRNEPIDSAIMVIGDRLKEGLEPSEYNFNFIIFKNEMINAFTVPGGNILISTGLIGFCDSPEELASVMAHEMGHVEKRHVLGRLIKELGLELLTSADPYVLGEVTGRLTSSRFDRSQEEEADQFASELLEKSSIEPRILATFFRKLNEEAGSDILEHFEIISTHPNFRSRIRHALSYSPDEDFEPRAFNLDWERIKSEL